jgi:rhamnosyltransferase
LKICAGIILFQPDIDKLFLNINSIDPQVDHVFIVDNASVNINEIKSKFNGGKYIWIQNTKNLGIAVALNQLIKYAQEYKYQWMITLDQDSVSDRFLVEKLCRGRKYYPRAAMITPYIVDVNLMSLGEYKMLDLPESETLQMCLTSGTLTNINAVINAGGFDEKLFIDHVDHDMCLRLRRNGYDIVRINSTFLLHEIGKGKRWVLFGRHIVYHNHNPKRVYYQTRNLLYMLRKYKKEFNKHPNVKFIYYCLAFVVKFILEPERWRRLLAFTRGFFAGLVIKIN